MSKAAPPTLIVLVQVVTDVDLLAPIVAAARHDGRLRARVLVTKKALRRAPEIEPLLARRFDAQSDPAGAPGWEKIDEDAIVAGRAPDLAGVAAVLAATESSAPAHQVAHHLALRANAAGLRTYTMQHGFENVGLTWFDADYPPGSVRFASRTIFTWGALERLHPDVAPDVRARCVPVGLSKPDARAQPLPPRPAAGLLVAVFENLHWSRYPPAYRDAFVAGLDGVARACPDATFFVRPHPAGKWLTDRFEGERPRGANVVVARPGERRFEPYDAVALVELADGVITTPSTIALDGARRGRPVALVAAGLALPAYEPLTRLDRADEWVGFVRSLADPAGRAGPIERARRFAEHHLLAGDAAARIVERIVADCAG